MFKQFEASTPGNATIFFMGTFYDAKSFVGDLVAKANESLVLIDDYVSKAREKFSNIMSPTTTRP